MTGNKRMALACATWAVAWCGIGWRPALAQGTPACNSCGDPPPSCSCPSSLPPNSTLTCGGLGNVLVQWTGVAGCPQLDVDFTVTMIGGSSGTPAVTIKSLKVGDFTVEEYHIGRKPDASGQPRDLNKVVSAWSSGQPNSAIIVRVGTVEGYPVRSIVGLSGVDIRKPPEGNDPYSSIQVQLVKDTTENLLGGDMGGKLAAEANSQGQGGRVRGLIEGDQGYAGSSDARIDCYAIGEGTSGVGTLRVEGGVHNTRLKQFPSTARLEAAGLFGASTITVEGPLDGTIRLRRLYGGDGMPHAAKILVQAKNLSVIDPDAVSRLPSHGKIIVAGGDLANDFFPCGECMGCSPCDVTGWELNDGTWMDADVTIEGDFAGKIYTWLWNFAQNLSQEATINIGRSMSSSVMQASLKPGAEIRSFMGNHSHPPEELVIQYLQLTVFGNVDGLGEGLPGALIENGGQAGQLSFVKVHGNMGGVVRVMYFYAGFVGSGATEVWVGGNLSGTIESKNLTAHAVNSCFKDSGIITIMGNVEANALISHTGNVGDYHLTDIHGKLFGWYLGGPPQKKYGGRLHVRGSLLPPGRVRIDSPLDSLLFPSVGGGRIDIDGDASSHIILSGSNLPPCRWLLGEPPACPGAGASPCAGPCPDAESAITTGGTDPNLCCQACPCQTCESPYDLEQSIQHPGAIARGHIMVGGTLTSAITLYGDIGPEGRVEVHGISDGIINIGLQEQPAGIRPFGTLDVSGPFESGSIFVSGALEGHLATRDLGLPGVGQDLAVISVAGNVTGDLTVFGEMRNALIDLNSVSGPTNGVITLGSKDVTWTAPEGAPDTIDIGQLNIHGPFGGSVTFLGCLRGQDVQHLRSICIDDPQGGTVEQEFCNHDPLEVDCP